jgi:hypothetical protein
MNVNGWNGMEWKKGIMNNNNVFLITNIFVVYYSLHMPNKNVISLIEKNSFSTKNIPMIKIRTKYHHQNFLFIFFFNVCKCSKFIFYF